MANWPQFAGWPAPIPAQKQQQASPPFPDGRGSSDFRPVSPFLHRAPRTSPPGVHRFSPRGSAPLSGPIGQSVYGNVHPDSGTSPGYNSHGWSPNPRGYPATMSMARALAPTMFRAQSQNFSHGNQMSVARPSRNFVLDQQSGLGLHDSWIASVAVPMSNDIRPHSATKPLFLNWIDECAKASSSVRDFGATDSSLKSSDLYELVGMVENTIAKIFALTELHASRAEWGLCPFKPGHVVPVEALLRHTLHCPKSEVEVDSLLDSLQYPRTVGVDTSDPVARGDRISEYAESSSNLATMSFEDSALLSVNISPNRKAGLETVKQESDPEETENLSQIPRIDSMAGIAKIWGEDPDCRTLTLSPSGQEFDPQGSLFFYRDAPGVVLTSVGHWSSQDSMSLMPPSLRAEMEKCPLVILEIAKKDDRRSVSSKRTMGCAALRLRHPGGPHGVEKESSSVSLLPSILLSVEKDLDSWKHMPSSCSRTVLEAATCLGSLQRALIVEWLLVHSPAYGVALDVAMAAHMSSLVQLYLRALGTQSWMLLNRGDVNSGDPSRDTMVVECPAYAEASTWLASWFAHLYGPINSDAVVLGLLKHCLNACGRFLSIVPLNLHSQQAILTNAEAVKAASDREFKVFIELSEETFNACVCVSNLEEVLQVNHVCAAMDALYERANFNRYVKSGFSISNATKSQRIADYDMKVTFAMNERAKRANYRGVCEHDGLTWQRSQQEEKKNKTKAEILAAERDYKRRRMSYRGKKLKRTPLQVLRDIIGNHMTEIMEVGGIGCFSKQPLPFPSESLTDSASQQLSQQGSILTNPDVLHHSSSPLYSRTADRGTAFKASRHHDERRETSSDFRNESRRNSKFYDERHHHSGR